eukprot:2418494-Rhodomonas_salina.3
MVQGQYTEEGVDPLQSAVAQGDNLLSLPLGLVGQLWPPGRVVLGRRVCKLLHQELMAHSHGVLLVKSLHSIACEQELVQDLARVASAAQVCPHRWHASICGDNADVCCR